MLNTALDGQVALVTGASRGIGSSIALKLASLGARIAVNYNASHQDAETIVSQIISNGGEAILAQGDVSDEKSVSLVMEQITDHWGQVDILINNAGVTRDKLLLRMSMEDWDTVIDIDLKSVFLCTKYIMPQLIKRRSGRVVNISSVVGIAGNPGQANYAAAKAGLIGFTKAVAREVASRNVTVNAVAPGFIDSGGMVEQLSEDARKNILGRIPMGRFGTGGEVSDLVGFLCLPTAGYITGQVFTIDGGLIA